MRVLSLFDGISCGHVALDRAGIPIEVYYASEIDKYAIQITQKNYPNTIQLGDINDIDFTQFIGKVDLVMGGSPCQDLSIAGKRAGLSGDRSGLFYKFVEAIKTIKPKYFLLENNVGMPQDAYEEISRLIGCYPIEINSALLSAQNRRRFYWTNIGPQDYNLFGFPTVAIPQPENKGILLKDILESGIADRPKCGCLTANDWKGNGANPLEYMSKHQPKPYVAEPISYVEKHLQSLSDKLGYVPIQFNAYNEKEIVEKTPTLTCFSGSQTSTSAVNIFTPIRLSEYEKSQGQAQRVYSVRGKSVALNANGGGQGGKTGLYKIDLPDGDYIIRKLTPIECERLQTLPDGYTEGVSNTQRYKAIGNGWTVDVIAHIFSYMEEAING